MSLTLLLGGGEWWVQCMKTQTLSRHQIHWWLAFQPPVSSMVRTKDEDTRKCVDLTGCTAMFSNLPACLQGPSEGWMVFRPCPCCRWFCWALDKSQSQCHQKYTSASARWVGEETRPTVTLVHSFGVLGRSEAGTVFPYCSNLNSIVFISFCVAVMKFLDQSDLGECVYSSFHWEVQCIMGSKGSRSSKNLVIYHLCRRKMTIHEESLVSSSHSARS